LQKLNNYSTSKKNSYQSRFWIYNSCFRFFIMLSEILDILSRLHFIFKIPSLNPVDNLKKLQARITLECNEITPRVLEHVFDNVKRREALCS
jgi:hypothetical protein